MVSQTVDLTITLTCFISITSSDLGLSSNRHLTLLLNKIELTGKADIKNHEFIVASLAYTVKLSKNKMNFTSSPHSVYWDYLRLKRCLFKSTTGLWLFSNPTNIQGWVLFDN